MVVVGFKNDSVSFLRLLSLSHSRQPLRHCERLQAARQSIFGSRIRAERFWAAHPSAALFFLDCFPPRFARARNDAVGKKKQKCLDALMKKNTPHKFFNT